MKQGTVDESGQITLLVFKDNYAARVFQIPLSWLSRVGILLGLFLILTVISILTAIKYYRVAQETETSRMEDVQQAFSFFPPVASTRFPNPSSPFSISSALGEWHDNSLRVQFQVRVVQKDQISGQEKFIILARSPERLLVYPQGAFSPVVNRYLISSQKGELIQGDSRQDIHVEFGPLSSEKDLKEVEIFIFDKMGKLLNYQTFPVSKQIAPIAPIAPMEGSPTPLAPAPPTKEEKVKPL